MDWRHEAICRDEDPELFFPVGNSGPALSQIAQAKLVCHRCPVTSECLKWALETGQDDVQQPEKAQGPVINGEPTTGSSSPISKGSSGGKKSGKGKSGS